jgi:uncharacterized protein YecT (DUF1311 family)
VKISIYLACLFILLLASCSISSKSKNANPSVTTVEVTRIVQITTTPIFTETVTPALTLNAMDQSATAAEQIGTPIFANDDCYKTAQTQSDLNVCAVTRLKELESQMGDLLTAIENFYQERLPEGLEKFQTFHKEWEKISNSECLFRSGLEGDWGGSIARMNYSECMVAKYEDRLREYQIELFEWTQ